MAIKEFKPYLELLTQRINRFDPFNETWNFYLVGAKTVLSTMVMQSDIIGFSIVKGKPVAWLPFDAFSPGRLGEFYWVRDSQDNLKKMGLQKLDLTIEDAELAYQAITWDRAKPESREALASKMLQLKPSSKFTRTKPILFRGLTFDETTIASLKAGKPFKLKPRTLTSWSIHKENAMVFAKAGKGIVIECKAADLKIFCNLQAVNDVWKLPLAERWAYENEVLVHGNGVEVLDPKKLKLIYT